ncbi:MAG: DUF4126 family protein [Chloroflexota bacterium]
MQAEMNTQLAWTIAAMQDAGPSLQEAGATLIGGLSSVLGAGGLALAAGCAPAIPLAALALLGAYGGLAVQPPVTELGSSSGLAAVAGLGLTSLLGGKVAVLGGLRRALDLPIVVASGAIVATAIPSPMSGTHPALPMTVGAVLALTACLVRAIPSLAVRPLPAPARRGLEGFFGVAAALAGLVLTATALMAPALVPVVVAVGAILSVVLTLLIARKAGTELFRLREPMIQSLLALRTKLQPQATATGWAPKPGHPTDWLTGPVPATEPMAPARPPVTVPTVVAPSTGPRPSGTDWLTGPS